MLFKMIVHVSFTDVCLLVLKFVIHDEVLAKDSRALLFSSYEVKRIFSLDSHAALTLNL